MSLPFTIKFFRKIEDYQTLKRLDLQEKNRGRGTWEMEKKILRWTYWGHKHLGSPLFEYDLYGDIREVREKKFKYHLGACCNGLDNEKKLGESHEYNLNLARRFLEKLEEEGLNCFFCLIKKKESDQIQEVKKKLNLEETTGTDIHNIWKNMIDNLKNAKIDRYEPKLNDLKIKDKDFSVHGRDKVLESLVSRGFAKFKNFQDITDGILITESGLAMGEVVWECTRINGNNTLCKNWTFTLLYKGWISLGWLLIFLGVIVLISNILDTWGVLDIVKRDMGHIFGSGIKNIAVAYAGDIFMFFVAILFVVIVLSFSVNILVKNHQ